jgi:DNA relaxase NicK
MTPQKTTVDWLRVRVQVEPRDALEALRPMYGNMGQYLHFGEMGKGILGFRSALPVLMADVPVGRMDFGGESQRGWVRLDLPGSGCQWVQDWEASEALEALERAELRRVDLALTTWDGEMGHGQVVAAHAAGRFVTGGRPPALQQITSSDPRAGRTCYVGKREKAPRFLRGYERGYLMVAKLPGVVAAIDGKRVEDIYRVEVELKAEGADIPWEVIERRDQYFAGAYPFCADLLPGVEADILMRRPERDPQLDLVAVLANARIQYGNALFTALHAYHGDVFAVWDQIIGKEHSRALVEAGVLLVDHQTGDRGKPSL